MKAIQTKYAGCHFRSRLEARWAVFFDTVGIRWEYEEQGYMCPHRMTLEEGEFPYLPDFWLPELGMFAEVKGSLTAAELWKVLHAAAHFSDHGKDMLFLGHLPHPDKYRVPFQLQWHKGNLFGFPWANPGTRSGSRFSHVGWDLGGDNGDRYGSDAEMSEILLDMAYPLVPDDRFYSQDRANIWYHEVADHRDTFERGYEEARSARF